MRLEDALLNWLQIQMVADARPDDQAALDTCQFFRQVLQEDYGIADIRVERKDETMVHVRYVQGERSKLQLIDRDAAEQLFNDLASNPKYYS